MRYMKKMTLTVLALIPTAVAAHTVKAPHLGTVTATTYYSNGALHGAVDIAPSFGCAGDDVHSPMGVYWNIRIMTLDTQCSNLSQNEARHLFADGWTFRVMHFVTSSNATGCTSCILGKTGSHTHLEYSKNGTLDSSWYSGYTTKGEAVDRTETVGFVQD